MPGTLGVGGLLPCRIVPPCSPHAQGPVPPPGSLLPRSGPGWASARLEPAAALCLHPGRNVCRVGYGGLQVPEQDVQAVLRVTLLLPVRASARGGPPLGAGKEEAQHQAAAAPPPVPGAPETLDGAVGPQDKRQIDRHGVATPGTPEPSVSTKELRL